MFGGVMDTKLDHRICLWQEPKEYLVGRILDLEAENEVLKSSLTKIASAKDAHIDDLTKQFQEYVEHTTNQMVGMQTTINKLQAQLAVDREAINHNFNKKEAENVNSEIEPNREC